MVSGLAMSCSKKIGAITPKTRLKLFNLAILKLINSGKVLRALLSESKSNSQNCSQSHNTKSTIHEFKITSIVHTYRRGEIHSHKRKCNRCRRRLLQNRTHLAVHSVLLHSKSGSSRNFFGWEGKWVGEREG